MAWERGQSGNPKGAQREKKFLNALERAVSQDDGKKLRDAAEKLLDEAAKGEAWAIAMLADRLDGKPGQSIEMNVTRDVREYSLEELVERLAALRGTTAAGVDRKEASASVPSELH